MLAFNVSDVLLPSLAGGTGTCNVDMQAVPLLDRM